MSQGRASLKRFRSAFDRFMRTTMLAFLVRLSASAERSEVVAQPELQELQAPYPVQPAARPDRARANQEARRVRQERPALWVQAANSAGACRESSWSAPC